MVEAVGIEPTSENLQQQSLHAYPASSIRPQGNRNRQTNLLNALQ